VGFASGPAVAALAMALWTRFVGEGFAVAPSVVILAGSLVHLVLHLLYFPSAVPYASRLSVLSQGSSIPTLPGSLKGTPMLMAFFATAALQYLTSNVESAMSMRFYIWGWPNEYAGIAVSATFMVCIPASIVLMRRRHCQQDVDDARTDTFVLRSLFAISLVPLVIIPAVSSRLHLALQSVDVRFVSFGLMQLSDIALFYL